jgi:hypothetical protein
LQDALEQHRQLGGRLVAVFLGQLDHGVLHDVKCRFFLADRVGGLLESAPLDIF